MQINTDKNNAIILTEETLKKLAEKISYKKGISAIILSTKVEIAEVDNIKSGKIFFGLRGGMGKYFEIIDNIIYEDDVYYTSVEELLQKAS